MEHNFIDKAQINFNSYTVEIASRPCARRPEPPDRVGGQCLKSADFTQYRALHCTGAKGDATARSLLRVLGQMSRIFQSRSRTVLDLIRQFPVLDFFCISCRLKEF